MTRHALELVGVPDGLVEERRVALVVTFRALATVDHVGVGHVALVVRSGRIAVAARGEHDLSTDTVSAVLVHVLLVREEVAVARALRGPAVVHAVHADGLLAKRQLGHVVRSPGRGWRVRNGTGEVAEARVTSEHLKALRESLQVVADEKVVCEHTTDLGNDLGLAILVDEVEGRGPVGGLVVVELARGALRLTEHVIGGRLGEVCRLLANCTIRETAPASGAHMESRCMNDSRGPCHLGVPLFGRSLTDPEHMLTHHTPCQEGRSRRGRSSLTASTVDGVAVRGSSSLVDDGVETRKRSAVGTGHAPEGAGSAGEDGRRVEGCERLHG